jgi:2-iminoacetate synthase
MNPVAPQRSWLHPDPWLPLARTATDADVRAAMASAAPAERELAALLSPAAEPHLEGLAARARHLTRRHFGATVSLYVPLYLSSHCSGGCAYCGFAADRALPRQRLDADALERELDALARLGFHDVLLLTGERTPEADFAYLRYAVGRAATRFAAVAVEAFAMTEPEYLELADAGCTGVTLYQETYDPERYAAMHRWGPKRDYADRLDAPARVGAAGLRSVGIGALLGLGDPAREAIALLQHARELRRRYWRTGLQISFPRLRPESGGYAPPAPVSDRFLARMVFALRLCLPDVPLVLSTRESPAFRDGMAGLGITRMSVASRTTVGGYADAAPPTTPGQFEVHDTRDLPTFVRALHAKGLEPVFKDWDASFRATPGTDPCVPAT